MAAAAKCDEGHVLISTGDPVSPWRCGPVLSEMATVAIEEMADAASEDEKFERWPWTFVWTDHLVL